MSGKNTSNGKNRLLTHFVQDEIESQILPKLHPGDMLPPQSNLCARFNVGPPTLVSAMKVLEKKGRIVRIQGRGTFVTDPEAPVIAIGNLRSTDHRGSQFIDEVEKQVTQEHRESPLRLRQFEEYPTSRDLVSEGIRGILFLANIHDDDYLRDLTGHGIHVIICDWAPSIPGVESFNVDSFCAAELAVKKLIDAEHTRIGYVGYQIHNGEKGKYDYEPDSEFHRSGVISALSSRGLEVDESLLVRLRPISPYRYRENSFSIQDIFDQLFDREDPSTALVCFDRGSVGMRLMRRLGEAKLFVPRDVSIIVCGSTEGAGNLACAGCSWVTLVGLALKRLRWRVQFGKIEPSQKVLIEPGFVEGMSIRAISEKPRKKDSRR